MKIKYNDNQTVNIGMTEYVQEVIDTFNQESPVTSSIATPALKKLFEVNEEFPRLDEHRSSIFHHCVAKLLYVSTRCRRILDGYVVDPYEYE